MKHEAIIHILKRYPRASYYALLVAATIFAFLGTCSFMLVQGRELVWTQDALPLYCNFLVWSSQTFEHVLDEAMSGGGIAAPQYTFTMGYGADVPMTMGSYVQDPVNIIAFALPNELIGLSYTLMILARMILAAITFSWYCFSHGHGRKATGVAAIAYVTCGFVILLGAFRHAKFMDWSILLPLVLAGADRLFQKRSPALFVLALVLQFFVSIYFSYMTCIVLLVYCLIKYFFMPRKRSVRDFLSLVFRFLACGCIAFLICGVFAIPQVVALLSQGRATSGGVSVPLLFTLKYYAKVASHLIGAAGTTEGLVIGGTSTLGLLVFFLCGKHFEPSLHRSWSVGLILCIAGILIPFLGHVMNGMGYSTDRWMLVLAFAASYALCVALPLLPQLEHADWKRIGIGVALISGLSTAYALMQVFMSDGPRATIWPLCLTVVFVATFLALKSLAKRSFHMRMYLCAGVSIIMSATLAATFYCSPLGQDWGTSFPKSGSTWASISEKSPACAAELIDDPGIWRYTLPRVHGSMKNSSLAHDVMGIDYYTSYYNQSVDDFRQELGISDHHMNFSFIGSDSRLAIEDLTGAKYYICKSKDEWRVPYGFKDTGIQHSGFSVFENEQPVPFAFLAPTTISPEEYNAYSMAQKQEALLQAAVIGNTEAASATMGQETGSSHSRVSFDSRAINFKVLESKGLVFDLEQNTVHVHDKDATVTLGFNGVADAETYLCITNLGYREYSPSEIATLAGKSISIKDRIADLLWTRTTTYPITARVGDRTKTSTPATPEHLRYGGKVDWVFNLCYSSEPLHEMTIEFSEVGDYTFDELEIVCQPVKPIVQHAKKLAEAGLTELQLGTNAMQAQCELQDDNPHVAVFTIAYSPGWSVTVDGEPAETLKADTAFLGVEVSGKGTHNIAWSYSTPGLREGAIMTILGLLLFVGMLVLRRLRHKVQ